MTYIIDGHQDLAYNVLNFQRNYHLSVAMSRAREAGTEIPEDTGETLLGWPEFQQGQVAVILATLFATPAKYRFSRLDQVVYRNSSEAEAFFRQQVDIYKRWDEETPEQFRLIKDRQGLNQVISNWTNKPVQYPESTQPVGLVLTMEGVEAIGGVEEMEFWWQQGVRIAGPVWAGTRFCGGTFRRGSFTSEGYTLLNVMQDLGYILDLSHMNEISALQALDAYSGPVVATHANAKALLGNEESERNFSDEVIAGLINRDGIMGIVPFNTFLKSGWRTGDDRRDVGLQDVAAHIDHVCQLAGDARHVALGTDFDGGFGLRSVPKELDTIADLQKLPQYLYEKGYNEDDVQQIMGVNWKQFLENTLPAS